MLPLPLIVVPTNPPFGILNWQFKTPCSWNIWSYMYISFTLMNPKSYTLVYRSTYIESIWKIESFISRLRNFWNHSNYIQIRYYFNFFFLLNSFLRRTPSWGCRVWNHWNRTRILARYRSRMCYKRRWVDNSFHFLRSATRLFQGKIEALIKPHNVPSFSCCQTKINLLCAVSE